MKKINRKIEHFHHFHNFFNKVYLFSWSAIDRMRMYSGDLIWQPLTSVKTDWNVEFNESSHLNKSMHKKIGSECFQSPESSYHRLSEIDVVRMHSGESMYWIEQLSKSQRRNPLGTSKKALEHLFTRELLTFDKWSGIELPYSELLKHSRGNHSIFPTKISLKNSFLR